MLELLCSLKKQFTAPYFSFPPILQTFSNFIDLTKKKGVEGIKKIRNEKETRKNRDGW